MKTQTETATETFILPGGTLAQGNLIAYDYNHFSMPALFPLTSQLGELPDWSNATNPLTHDLNPIFFSKLDVPNEGALILTNLSMPRENLALVYYKKPKMDDTLFIAICFKATNDADNAGNESDTNFLSFAVPPAYIETEQNIVIHPLQDDPKTSRGTVTTVQSTQNTIKPLRINHN